MAVYLIQFEANTPVVFLVDGAAGANGNMGLNHHRGGGDRYPFFQIDSDFAGGGAGMDEQLARWLAVGFVIGVGSRIIVARIVIAGVPFAAGAYEGRQPLKGLTENVAAGKYFAAHR